MRAGWRAGFLHHPGNCRKEPTVPSAMPKDDLGLLGRSDVMEELRDVVRRVADAPFPVLVTGESGP